MIPSIPPEILQLLATQGQGEPGPAAPMRPTPIPQAQAAVAGPPAPMAPGGAQIQQPNQGLQGLAANALLPALMAGQAMQGGGIENLAGQMATSEQGKADELRRGALDIPLPNRHDGNLRPGQALAMAALSAIFHAFEKGSERGLQQGIQDSMRQRIEADYQAQLAKVQDKRAKAMFEAGIHEREAGRLGGVQQGFQKARADTADKNFELQKIIMQNQGRVDLQNTKNSAQTEMKLLEGYQKAGPALRPVLGRILREQFKDTYGSMTDADIDQAAARLFPKEEADLAGANLKKTQAEDLVATRPARIKKLLAEGDATGARAELAKAQAEASKARANLDKVKATWYPKEAGARIEKLHKDADAAIMRANNTAHKALSEGAGKGVTPTSYFNALNDVQDSLAKIGGLRAKLDEEVRISTERKNALVNKTAQNVDPAGSAKELAEIEALLRADQVQKAYLDEMEKRMNSRLEQINKSKTTEVSRIGGEGGAPQLPSIGKVEGTLGTQTVTGKRTGATLKLKGGK